MSNRGVILLALALALVQGRLHRRRLDALNTTKLMNAAGEPSYNAPTGANGLTAMDADDDSIFAATTSGVLMRMQNNMLERGNERRSTKKITMEDSWTI